MGIQLSGQESSGCLWKAGKWKAVFHIVVNGFKSLLHFGLQFTTNVCCWEAADDGSGTLIPAIYKGDLVSSELLASVWHSLCYCRHLSSERSLFTGRSLFLSFGLRNKMEINKLKNFRNIYYDIFDIIIVKNDILILKFIFRFIFLKVFLNQR